MNYFEMLDNVKMPDMQEFSKIEEGVYTAIIEECTAKEDPQWGMKLNAKMKITSDLHKGRVIFWSTMINDKTSETAMGYIKRSICTMAGVESTNGDAMGVFKSAEGNSAEVKIAYKAGTKDPTKEYMQVYIQKIVIPF